MYQLRFLFVVHLILSTPAIWAQPATPIPYAHAHNDYEHERPLLDALDHGFTSVEVDVFAIDGELYVYHNRPDRPDPDRTLRKCYLTPLRERIGQNGGRVYPGYTGNFHLMIDLKTGADETYPLIREQLEEYAGLFTRVASGREIPGPVMVFLSGNRPIADIIAADTHIAKLDGRPEDLGRGFPPSKMPVVSERYDKVLDWNGQGKMPVTQRKKLKTLLRQVHREGKQLRLWAMPEEEALWRTFLRLGMDWLNADDLDKMQRFFLRTR